MLLEENLKTIKDANLDIEILKRQNDVLCQENNIKIEGLQDIVKSTEANLEEILTKSGEKKLECKFGYCSFRTMPDKWEYDIPKLIKWAKEDDEREERYVKVIEEFKKAQLKKDYADGIIVHDDICDEGLTITSQNPKFGYKIKNGGNLL